MDPSRALGQFFTPAEVVDLCFGLLKWLQPGSQAGRLVDLSCGEGAFLQGALRAGFAPEALYGLDADPRLPEVWRAQRLLAQSHLALADGLVGQGEGRFEVVAGNPPFGGGADPEHDSYLAAQYHWRRLGKRRQADLPRELWFLERSLRLLKPGGLLAMVLPEGFFANCRWRPQREALIGLHQIEAIVGLPRTVFRGSGITVKTALLFLRKTPPPPGHRIRLAELAEDDLAAGAETLIEAWERAPVCAGRPWEAC